MPRCYEMNAKNMFLETDLSLDSSSDLLDFETEPCLMMESVLEDVPLPDTYSHNMVSSSDSLRRVLGTTENGTEENTRSGGRFADESTSLSNLTQAILHRRKVNRKDLNFVQLIGTYLASISFFYNLTILRSGRRRGRRRL